MSLEIESRFVKTGLWYVLTVRDGGGLRKHFTDTAAFSRTDLDRGNVMGKTITTDTQTGNLVVAIIAIVSTLGMPTQQY